MNLEANLHSLLSFPWTPSNNLFATKYCFLMPADDTSFSFFFSFSFRFLLFYVIINFYKNYFIVIIILFIYFHENYYYFFMFWVVPECSVFLVLSTPELTSKERLIIWNLNLRSTGGVCCGGFLFLTEQMLSLPIERSWGRCVSCAFHQIDYLQDLSLAEFFDLFWSIKLFIAPKWPFHREFSFSNLE